MANRSLLGHFYHYIRVSKPICLKNYKIAYRTNVLKGHRNRYIVHIDPLINLKFLHFKLRAGASTSRFCMSVCRSVCRSKKCQKLSKKCQNMSKKCQNKSYKIGRSVQLSICLSVGQKYVKKCQKSVKTCQKKCQNMSKSIKACQST